MKLIAEMPILHQGRQYNRGEEITDFNNETLQLWLKYKSVCIASENNDSDGSKISSELSGSPTLPDSFQAALENDLDTTFFNAEAKEFVTIHRIAGVRGEKASQVFECPVVVDYELYKERIIRMDSIENVSLDGLIFFIKKQEWLDKFKNIPKVKSSLMFDDKRYLVESAADDEGTLEITLSSPRG